MCKHIHKLHIFNLLGLRMCSALNFFWMYGLKICFHLFNLCFYQLLKRESRTSGFAPLNSSYKASCLFCCLGGCGGNVRTAYWDHRSAHNLVEPIRRLMDLLSFNLTAFQEAFFRWWISRNCAVVHKESKVAVYYNNLHQLRVKIGDCFSALS